MTYLLIFLFLLGVLKVLFKIKNNWTIIPFRWIMLEYFMITCVVLYLTQEKVFVLNTLTLNSNNAGVTLIKTFACMTTMIGLDYFFVQFLLKRRTLNPLQSINQTSRAFRTIVFDSSPLGNNIRLILLCIISAAIEEIIFRGFYFEWLALHGMNNFFALLLSSVVFGLYHFPNGIGQITYSSLFGMIFGSFYLLTDTLYAPMLAHIAGNLFTQFYSIAQLRKITTMPDFF